ncbi:cyclin-like protein [Apiospora marii]|uniref:RNA polymerase II holoenzyme cyclin-like subunit n=1 Tax=Apiospora marii TaxID=335849 RepID=A0ABR1RSY3_9PEZI
MASIDRYRPPAREGYQPPTRPPPNQHQQQQHHQLSSTTNSASANTNGARSASRSSKSPIKRRDVPPAVPTPPPHVHYPPPPAHTSSSHLSPRPRSRSARSPERSATEPAARRSMAANQWLFTHDEVNSSPSIAEGMPPAEERLRRAKGVNFIYNVGIMLNLPQLTLYVAGVFFHRFYMRCSMDEKRGIHHYNIAATALFLANKTEENGAKTKNIIIAVAKVAQKNANLIIDEQSKEYWRWRDSILSYEEVMLEYLTFDLSITHPYQILYKLLEDLNCIHNKDLRKSAWTFCNDSCLSVLPLLVESRDVALSSIFFASTITKQTIPDVGGKPWWIALEGSEARMSQACNVMVDFYKENPLRKADSPYQGSPNFNFDSTRYMGEGSSTNVSPRTENQTQSPEPRSKERANGHSNDETVVGDSATKGRPNGASNDANEDAMDIDESSKGGSFANPESQGLQQTGPGDSDTALKEAANDPATHEHTAQDDSRNADGFPSPAKRKEHQPISEENRDQKRPRRDSEEDEGEVLDE